MVLRLALMIVVVLHLRNLTSSSSVALFPVVDYHSRCLNDTLIYVCINSNGNYLTWDFSSESRTLYSLSLSFRNPIGRKYNETIGTTFIMVEIIARNTTYIASIATITGITTLFTRVECNGLEVLFNSSVYPRNNITALSSVILTLLDSDDESFRITWKSSWESQYIEVSSTSDELKDRFITYDNLIELNITNTTQVVEISVCPDKSAKFTIGPCFASKSNSIFTNYTIYSNTTWLVECNETHKQLNMCYDNGTWQYELCSNTETEETEDEDSTLFSSTYFFTSSDVATDQMLKQYSLRLLLTSSITPAGAVLLFTVILIIIISLSARHKRLRKASFQLKPPRGKTTTFQSENNELKENNYAEITAHAHYGDVNPVSGNKVKYNNDSQRIEEIPDEEIPSRRSLHDAAQHSSVTATIYVPENEKYRENVTVPNANSVSGYGASTGSQQISEEM